MKKRKKRDSAAAVIAYAFLHSLFFTVDPPAIMSFRRRHVHCRARRERSPALNMRKDSDTCSEQAARRYSERATEVAAMPCCHYFFVIFASTAFRYCML